MGKKLFSILIMSLCWQMSSFASDYKISYEDFIHLNQKQKVEVIRMAHDFLIEYESRYIIDQKKARQYQTYKKIMSFVLNEAYASDTIRNIPQSLKCYYGGWISFTKIGSNNKPYCVHPRKISYLKNKIYLLARAKKISISQLEGKSEAEIDKLLMDTDIGKFYIGNLTPKYKKYFEQAKSKSLVVKMNGENLSLETQDYACNAEHDIPCNPEIYGAYPSDQGPKTLCVPDKGNYGVNISYQCAKALDKIEQEENDKYKQMMNEVIANSSNEGSVLQTTIEAMYDTCLCSPSDSYDGLINHRYAKRLFSSRTCVGILSQTMRLGNEFIAQCKENPEAFQNLNPRIISFINQSQENFSKNIQQMVQKKISNLSGRAVNYSQIEQIFRDDESAFNELAMKNYKAAVSSGFCKAAPSRSIAQKNTPEDIQCSIDIAMDGENAKVSVSIAEFPEGQSLETIESINLSYSEDAVKPVKDKTNEFIIEKYDEARTLSASGSFKNGKATFSCENGPKDSDIELGCDISIKDGEESSTATVTLMPPEGEEAIEGLDLENLDLNASISKIEFKVLDGEVAQSKEAKNIFTITEFNPDAGYGAQGKITHKNKNYPFRCESAPKEKKEKAGPAKRCEVKIAHKPNPDSSGVLTAAVTFFDAEKDGKEVSNDEVKSYGIAWFDPTQRPQEEEQGDDESLEDSDFDAVEEEDEEDEETEEDEPKTVYELYKKNYARLQSSAIDEDKKIDMTFKHSPLPAKRKIIAVVDAEGITGCKAEYVVPAATASGPPNNSPTYQQLQNSRIFRGRGTIKRGQH